MLKRGFFSIGIFLFLISITFATASLDSWVSLGQIISFDNHTYFIANFTNNTLLLHSEVYGVIPMPYESILYTDAYEFTFAERNKTHYHILIDTLKPELKAERLVEPSSARLDGSITVNVAISNSGAKDARAVEYSELLPPYYRIEQPPKAVYLDGSEVELTSYPDKIYWNGEIPREDVVVIVYEAKLVSLPARLGYANLTPPTILYTYQNKRHAVGVQDISIPLQDPLHTNISYTQDELDLHEETAALITLTNPLTEAVFMNLSLIFPVLMDVVSLDQKLSHLSQQNKLSGYVWQGILEPNITIMFNTTLRAATRGVANLTLGLNWTSAGITTSALYTKPLFVRFKKLEPSIELNQKDFKKGDPIQVRFYIDNREDFYFKDVIVDIESDLFEPVHVRTHIPENNHLLVKEINITAPSYDAEKQFPIFFSGAYNAAGETFAFEKTDVIKIVLKEFDGLFNISHIPLLQRDNKARIHLAVKGVGETKPTAVILETTAKDFEEKYQLSEKEIDDIFYQYTLVRIVDIPLEERAYDLPLTTVVRYRLNDEDRTESKNDRFNVAELPQEQKTLPSEIPSERDTGLIRRLRTVVSHAALLSWKNIVLSIIIVLGIIGIVVFTLPSIKKYKKSHEHTEKVAAQIELVLPSGKTALEVPRPSTDHTFLVKYIETYKQYGIDTAAIKQHLLNEGWLEEVIDVYLG